MNLQQMLFVVETAKVGSISKAARSLYVSQPNLSKAIQSLEEELHVSLFVRNEKGVSLTKDGREFLQYAQSVLSQCHDIKTRFGKREPDQAVLRLSTNRLTFVTETLLELYNDKLRGADAFSLSIREVGPHMVYNDIIEGAANLAVVFLSKRSSPFWKKFLKSQNIETTYLFCSELKILLHKDHPLHSLSAVTLDDLKKYPIIQHLDDSTNSPNFREEIEQLRYKEFPRIIYASDRSVLSTVLNTTDAIFFTVASAKNERYHPDLSVIPLPPELPAVVWEFFLLQRKNTLLSPLETELAEYLIRLGEAEMAAATPGQGEDIKPGNSSQRVHGDA